MPNPNPNMLFPMNGWTFGVGGNPTPSGTTSSGNHNGQGQMMGGTAMVNNSVMPHDHVSDPWLSSNPHYHIYMPPIPPPLPKRPSKKCPVSKESSVMSSTPAAAPPAHPATMQPKPPPTTSEYPSTAPNAAPSTFKTAPAVAPISARKLRASAAPGTSVQQVEAISTNESKTGEIRAPYCVSPRFVVCEIESPKPPILSINAFSIDKHVLNTKIQVAARGVASGKVALIGQPNIARRPLFREHKFGLKSNVLVRSFSFQREHSLQVLNDTDMKMRKLNAKTNGGCTFVALVRIGDLFDTDIFIASIPGTMFEISTREPLRYLVNASKFVMLMKVFREEKIVDGPDVGVTIEMYINNVEDGEEVYVTQTQQSLVDTTLGSLKLMHVGGNEHTTGSVMPPSTEVPHVEHFEQAPMPMDLSYFGIYDRALNLAERRLIATSVKNIMDAQVNPNIKPKIALEYDIRLLTDELLDATPDMRRMLKDSSGNRHNLLYNIEGDSVSAQFRLTNTQTKCVELAKNEKFFSASPVYLETSAGYSMEFLFCAREFSRENDSIIFCYTTQDLNIRDPQLIVNITPNQKKNDRNSDSSDGTTKDGHHLSVYFSADLPRFECLVDLRLNKWYHVIITSESNIYINGAEAPATGNMVTWVPDLPDRGRYITIGDYKVTDSYKVSTDTGNSLGGYIALTRFYSAPMNEVGAKEAYQQIRKLDEFNAYGI